MSFLQVKWEKRETTKTLTLNPQVKDPFKGFAPEEIDTKTKGAKYLSNRVVFYLKMQEFILYFLKMECSGTMSSK